MKRPATEITSQESTPTCKELSQSPDLKLIQMNLLPSYRQQLLCEYVVQIIPMSKLGRLKEHMWFLSLPSLPNLSTALEVSAVALCAAKLGDYKQDKRLAFEGSRLYHRALGELIKALFRPESAMDDQTLAACALLTHYEMSQCPQNSVLAYTQHMLGFRKLVHMRGPERHATGMAHEIFLVFRTQEILHDIVTDQLGFITEPEWQQIPWQGRRKPAEDRIWDLLTLSPILLNHQRALEQMSLQDQPRAAMAIIKLCWDLDEQLTAICKEVLEGHETPRYWPVRPKYSSYDGGQDGDSMMPLAFYFEDLAAARLRITLWTAQALFWHTMTELYKRLSALWRANEAIDKQEQHPSLENFSMPAGDSPRADDYRLPPLEHRSDFFTPVYNIIRSTEFCLQDELLDLGAKTVAAPLRLAMETIRGIPEYEAEYRWGSRMMVEIQNRSLRMLALYVQDWEAVSSRTHVAPLK
ncbi:hypothetical protein B0A52_06831 [Exophiala mesophila]|uniref:Uncharacterized protein n=1 Tax=Exophiala mesophila TaxID=212818 RepID=A0A438N073_EXOME|nr:hypothetical protein B0A52_06831 [Exophiala mesophila]